jgi:hypothetical protein
MLPDELSTDLTSLVASQDRLAVVIETVIDRDGGGEIVRHLSSASPQSRQARLPERRPVARAEGSDAAGIGEVSGLADNSRSRTARRSASRVGARKRARWRSRPSSRARDSTATP